MITRPTEVAEGRGSKHSARKFILEILGRILCSRLDLSREQADRRIVELANYFSLYVNLGIFYVDMYSCRTPI